MTSIIEFRRVVLVTGCGSPVSLGAALALAFLSHGFRVFATCRAPIERMASLEKGGCELIELDLTSEKTILAAVSEVERRTGGTLDVVVNNVSWDSFPRLDFTL